MNYATHYDRLMDRARGRELTGYRERHHVVPRCMGGTNATQNLVYLTGEEHFVAHQLLVKIYPRHGGLVHAASMMANTRTTNKYYGWVRRRQAIATSLLHKGKPKSAEHRRKIGASNAGKINSKEAIAKSVAKHRGRKHSAEHRAKISAAGMGRKGKSPTAEQREHLAKLRRGKSLSEETRAKISEALRKRIRTPETCAKLSAALRGKVRSPEHCAALTAAKLGRKCPWISESNRRRALAAREAVAL